MDSPIEVVSAKELGALGAAMLIRNKIIGL